MIIIPFSAFQLYMLHFRFLLTAWALFRRIYVLSLHMHILTAIILSNLVTDQDEETPPCQSPVSQSSSLDSDGE